MAWNGSDNGNSTTQTPDSYAAVGKSSAAGAARPRSHLRGLIAGLVVVIGGAIVAWYFLNQPAARPNATRVDAYEPTGLIETTPQVISNRQAAVVAEPVVPTNRNVRLEKGIEVLRSVVTTNKNGAVTERLWLADGTTKRKIHPPKPVFENPSDQLIAMALSVEPGQSMPPLPGLANVDDDFAKSLLSPIRIEETDTDEVKEIKARVIEARAYLAEEIKNGGTVQEALRQYQADMEKYADSHLMALQQINEIRETDGDAAAEEFRQRINESFRARGIPELETTDHSRDESDDGNAETINSENEKQEEETK